MIITYINIWCLNLRGCYKLLGLKNMTKIVFKQSLQKLILYSMLTKLNVDTTFNTNNKSSKTVIKSVAI